MFRFYGNGSLTHRAFSDCRGSVCVCGRWGLAETKYGMICSYIRNYIEEHKFTNDNKIPSEQFLCRKFGVSRQTVRTAIRHMVETGFLYAVKGSGTFFNKTFSILSVPDAAAGRLKIGLIIQGQDFNANSNLVQGIRTILDERDVDLKIFLTDNKISNERKCLVACSSGFDALIIDGVKASIINPNLDAYEKIHEKNVRVIFYNNYYKNTNFPKVIIDDAKCADELVRLLTDKGHKFIAGFFIYDNYQGIEKYRGVLTSLIKYGAYCDDAYIKWNMSDDMRDGKTFKKLIWNFLKSLPKCTAIICCNYMILEMLQEVLQEHGKTIPDDYSVVSFDYSDTDWQLTGITSSIHPGFDMGVETAKRILNMLDDAAYKSHDYSFMFPPRIYHGNSIKAIGTSR